MKSNVRRSPQRSCLATRSCARFSPASVMPASASTPTSSSGTYFTAARTSTSAGSRPARAHAAAISARTALEVRADPLGVQAVDQLRHATPPCRPGGLALAAVGPEAARGAQIVQSPASWISVTPACSSMRARDGGEVGVRAAPRARARSRRTPRGPRRRPRSSRRARPARSRRGSRVAPSSRSARDARLRRRRARARASRRGRRRPPRARSARPAGSRRCARRRRRPAAS